MCVQVLSRKQLLQMQCAIISQQATELAEQWTALQQQEDSLRAAGEQ
jgi:hypothetical protein